MENHFDPVNEFKLSSILGETYLSFFVFALSFHLSKQNLVEPFLFVTYTIANRQGLLERNISFCVPIPSITVSTSGSLMVNIFLELFIKFRKQLRCQHHITNPEIVFMLHVQTDKTDLFFVTLDDNKNPLELLDKSGVQV